MSESGKVHKLQVSECFSLHKFTDVSSSCPPWCNICDLCIAHSIIPQNSLILRISFTHPWILHFGSLVIRTLWWLDLDCAISTLCSCCTCTAQNRTTRALGPVVTVQLVPNGNWQCPCSWRIYGRQVSPHYHRLRVRSCLTFEAKISVFKRFVRAKRCCVHALFSNKRRFKTRISNKHAFQNADSTTGVRSCLTFEAKISVFVPVIRAKRCCVGMLIFGINVVSKRWFKTPTKCAFTIVVRAKRWF